MDAPQDPLEDRISAELEGPLRDLGLDLDVVEVTPAGRRRMLRVAVDQDGGVTLDDVAEATRVVGDALDAGEAMGDQPYTLEVTSRGVDRPLVLPRHWRRNRDRLVRVTRTDGDALTGRVLEAGEQEAVLDVSGVPTTVPYATVTKALVQVELNRRATPVAEEES